MKTNAIGTWRTLPLVLAALFLAAGFPAARAQAPSTPTAPKDAHYAVEYYYKVSWGHADEWLRLFKKNHLPVLKTLQSQGHIVELEMEKPRYHTAEDGRWDYRVTIVWKNFAASENTSGDQAIIHKLFPDQETYQREEQRRFEILIAHWDLPTVEVSTEP
jgi:hypothetical protein